MTLPRRHRAMRLLERYVLNPQMRFGLRRGLVPPNFALLETVGRRTGQPRHTPVGGGLVGDSFWLVAEHGRGCDYVRNLLADPHVRLLLRRHWYEGVATVLPADDAWQRRRDLDRMHGLPGRIDGAIFRGSATAPLTVRIDLTGSRR